MDTPQPTERSSLSWSAWAGLSLWVFVLIYFLSPGPVYVYVMAGQLNNNVLKIYAPLWTACDRIRIVGDFYDWYLDIWV